MGFLRILSIECTESFVSCCLYVKTKDLLLLGAVDVVKKCTRWNNLLFLYPL
jgi:hypothetical protein